MDRLISQKKKLLKKQELKLKRLQKEQLRTQAGVPPGPVTPACPQPWPAADCAQPFPQPPGLLTPLILSPCSLLPVGGVLLFSHLQATGTPRTTTALSHPRLFLELVRAPQPSAWLRSRAPVPGPPTTQSQKSRPGLPGAAAVRQLGQLFPVPPFPRPGCCLQGHFHFHRHQHQ